MEIVLLGTGAADGWPNAFCRCASCRAQAAAGTLRAPTSALVDDRVLLDCGPETPRSALRAGRPLDRVEVILLTHAHPDHSAPMALLSRSWAGRREPIVVAGPAEVLEPWRLWVGPDDPVRFQPVTAGTTLDLAGYTVRVLPAAHVQPAVLYLLEDAAGHRLLYATDTGPLPDAAVTTLADHPVDVLLLEETFGDDTANQRPDHPVHLDLPSFGRELARLRTAGTLRPDAQVVAVHLAHGNPPEPLLQQRLGAWGARPGHDGEVLSTSGASTSGASTSEPSTSEPAPPRRTLILGGARSGKSTAAERLLGSEPAVVYVATGQPADDTDPEWAARVAHHRQRRPASWSTVETPDAATALRAARAPVLLDCLGTWLTGVLTETGAWDDAPGWEERAEQRIEDLLAALRDTTVDVVVVSNEVGSGVVPAHPSGLVFRDWLGRLNQAVAAASERVLLVVAGRTVELG